MAGHLIVKSTCFSSKPFPSSAAGKLWWRISYSLNLQFKRGMSIANEMAISETNSQIQRVASVQFNTPFLDLLQDTKKEREYSC
ncbi:hypothetical protein K1719_002461 [Acacia pycnantha]|nr:hypothetical protein K1719_002461 [Acacia pycnantha]